MPSCMRCALPLCSGRQHAVMKYIGERRLSSAVPLGREAVDSELNKATSDAM